MADPAREPRRLPTVDVEGLAFTIADRGGRRQTVRGDSMDNARVTTIVSPKRRAQRAGDGPVDYVGRHARSGRSEPQAAFARHPRAHGFSILSRLARADDLTAAAV
jgi:hypothetical protein